VKFSAFVKTLNSNGPFLMITVTALILTGLIGYVSIRIEEIYRQNHPYRSLDPVYYMYYNAKLYSDLEDESRLSVATDEWLNNTRHPLRTTPLVLLAPEWLAHPYGYMATSLPMFAIMLWVMGWTVHMRTGYILYSIAVMSLLGGTAYLFNVEYGIAVYWLDAPMSYLFGAAIISLVNSRGKEISWLVAFAIFSAGAILSRYIAVVYILFTSVPLLVYYLIRRWREEQNFLKAIVFPITLIATIVLPLAGPFLFGHFETVVEFYTTYGYAVGFSIQEALLWGLKSFVTVVSPEWLWILVSMAFFNLYLIWYNKNQDRENLIISLWLATSVFILFGTVIRAGAGVHVLPTAVPLVATAFCAPVQWNKSEQNYTRWIITGVAVLSMIASINLASRFIKQNDAVASNPSESDRDNKAFENALADILRAENRHVVWNVYFAEFAWKPTMVSFFQSKILPLPAGQVYYNEHLTAWKADYPGLNPQEIADRIHAASNQWVDIAVVLEDPQQAMDAEWLTNDYSRIIAAEMTTRLLQDENWQEVTRLTNLYYGNVIVYRNLNSNGEAYQEIFHGGLHP
jgi:hypothetical protein